MPEQESVWGPREEGRREREEVAIAIASERQIFFSPEVWSGCYWLHRTWSDWVLTKEDSRERTQRPSRPSVEAEPEDPITSTVNLPTW